jgi:anaerobic sulfite reductase subunit C
MAMEWTQDAEQAISRVPFFIRKRVRKRVEEEALRSRSDVVRAPHVNACQQRFLKQMDGEVGPNGCPNRAVEDGELAAELEALAEERDLKAFLRDRVQGPLKLHHEFRIVLADCPNACSRPQIVDVGIIGALRPKIGDQPCSSCAACVDACKEAAASLDAGTDGPTIDFARCVACGQCVSSCPTGALQPGLRGYRIQVGGKLGRHPQLGRELPRIYSRPEVLQVTAACLDHYMRHNGSGERFGEILNRNGLPKGPLFEAEKKEGP